MNAGLLANPGLGNHAEDPGGERVVGTALNRFWGVLPPLGSQQQGAVI